MRTAFCLSFLVLIASGVSAATPARVEVETSLGTVVGVVEDGIQQFRGIPYAAPPVGPLRWRAPHPSPAWGQLDAAEYGPVCPQMRETDLPESEDCLTLNILAPAESDGLRPVMVWIHGGAHVNGSGRINGESFARDGIVLVSINYRLGRLGVFAHPELSASLGAGEATANFGLLDQIEALKWVQREISAFGGDPRRVTIFGVSAGGSYVNLLMASPLATGLFHGAISESGANGLSRGRRLAAQEELGVAFAERKGADNLTELQALPWQEIIESDNRHRQESGPMVDGVAITEDVPETFLHGRQNNVPYIAGANSFEGSLAAAIPIPAFDRILEENREEAEQVYELGDGDPTLQLAFYGDILFVAPTRHLVREMRNVPAPAWRYHFDHVLTAFDDAVPGARHGGEVAYVFDRLAPVDIGPGLAQFWGIPTGSYVPTADDHAVAAMIHRYWVQFAKTGSPNLPGQPVWPAYDAETDPAMVFSNNGVGVQNGLWDARLDMIDEGYRSQQN